MIDVGELSADSGGASPGQVILGCIRKHHPYRKPIEAFPALLPCALLLQLPQRGTVQWKYKPNKPSLPLFALAHYSNWKKTRRGSWVLQLLQNVSQSSVFSEPVKGRIFRQCHLQKGSEIIEGVFLKGHSAETFIAVFCFLTLVMYYTTPDSEQEHQATIYWNSASKWIFLSLYYLLLVLCDNNRKIIEKSHLKIFNTWRKYNG